MEPKAFLSAIALQNCTLLCQQYTIILKNIQESQMLYQDEHIKVIPGIQDVIKDLKYEVNGKDYVVVYKSSNQSVKNTLTQDFKGWYSTHVAPGANALQETVFGADPFVAVPGGGTGLTSSEESWITGSAASIKSIDFSVKSDELAEGHTPRPGSIHIDYIVHEDFRSTASSSAVVPSTAETSCSPSAKLSKMIGKTVDSNRSYVDAITSNIGVSSTITDSVKIEQVITAKDQELEKEAYQQYMKIQQQSELLEAQQQEIQGLSQELPIYRTKMHLMKHFIRLMFQKQGHQLPNDVLEEPAGTTCHSK